MPWGRLVRGTGAAVAATLSCLLLPAAQRTSFAQSSSLDQPAFDPLRLPDGFVAHVFAEDLGSPRFMAFGADGSLYVTESRGGRVLRLLQDVDGDGQADSVSVLLEYLDEPAGIAWHAGSLWLAEAGRILRIAGPFDDRTRTRNDFSVVVDSLPGDGSSGEGLWIEPGGGGLLLAIGASCDVCVESDRRRAAIVRYDLDGTGEQIWARGLQRTLGLAVHPVTGELWATDSGRGRLGSDLPPDEVNVIRRGRHYGWPFCYGARIPSPEYADPARCDATEPPIVYFEASAAPRGITFYTGEMFPAEYRGDAFVALHGSASPATYTGYKLVRIRVEAGRPRAVEDFATGWLGLDRRIIGRPVQPLVGPDGALYVSDDYGGRVWRFVYEGEKDGA